MSQTGITSTFDLDDAKLMVELDDVLMRCVFCSELHATEHFDALLRALRKVREMRVKLGIPDTVFASPGAS